uniref:Uncharacterized protein n=1 Tax=Salix viminalis TaxID=40686 RepID=A0A6N2MT47_SALVM
MREVLFPKANFRPNACVAEINNLTDSCRDFEREFEADSAEQQSSTTPVMGKHLGRGQNPTSADSFEKKGKRGGAVGIGSSSRQAQPTSGTGRMVRTRQGARTEPPSFERRGGNQGTQVWQDEDPLDDTASHVPMTTTDILQGETGVAGEGGRPNQTERIPPVAAEQQERS